MKTKTFLVLFILLLIVGIGIYLLSGRIRSSAENIDEEDAWQEEPVAEETQTSQPEQVAASADLELLPTMETVSEAANQVWAGTFQLVWNDFCNELLKGPARFAETQPLVADQLNKQVFTVSDLSPNAYYKKWGLVSPQLKQEIEQGIQTKFNEKSKILDMFNWTPVPDTYFLYAMLKKNFEFIKTFSPMGLGSFRGSNTEVAYFGTEDTAVKQTVWVLFYKNANEFAVRLQSKQGDHVYLYRTDFQGTLAELYQNMKREILAYPDSGWLSDQDKFKAPVLDFNTTKEFTEFYNKRILPDWSIGKAVETVQFKMDETGVKLVSEAGMMALRGVEVGKRPRHFDFDARYAVFIAERGKKPYFALLVNDAAALQKAEAQQEAAAIAKYQQGLDAFMQNDFETAMKDWDDVTKLDPENKDIQEGLKKLSEIMKKTKSDLK